MTKLEQALKSAVAMELKPGGKYVFFLDSNAVLEPHTLADIINEPDSPFATCDVQFLLLHHRDGTKSISDLVAAYELEP